MPIRALRALGSSTKSKYPSGRRWLSTIGSPVANESCQIQAQSECDGGAKTQKDQTQGMLMNL